MDSIWAIRAAYNHAQEIKNIQAAYCRKAEGGLWGEIKDGVFPSDLRWEKLVDVLWGNAKVRSTA